MRMDEGKHRRVDDLEQARGLRSTPAMDTFRLRSILRRHSPWLLWLALLLPVAQATASTHAISHVRQEVCRTALDNCVHPSSCDLCLLGAAIAGTAPAGDPPAVVVPELRDERPSTFAVASPDGRFDPVYRSRAPPSAPR